ncbi:hypothetical protein HCH_03359 [Hahella chejuensis KCTC 2396]|uniref:Uncharacterized protein n=1 Tax=Hahella chejuensis (strain KCTC 2396) TaxID=349521 RepID=Q2SGW1_HAHCH|nr:hypothetical protein HCH_03359 [Hahella chejuensis KCTC 2396]
MCLNKRFIMRQRTRSKRRWALSKHAGTIKAHLTGVCRYSALSLACLIVTFTSTNPFIVRITDDTHRRPLYFPPFPMSFGILVCWDVLMGERMPRSYNALWVLLIKGVAVLQPIIHFRYPSESFGN